MAGNPACERFVPLLSPYIDGELSPTERVNVERHLTACRDCTGRAADLRAESALLRVGMEMAVDEVDFKDFTQRVLARVTPEKPPLLERLRISLSELFLYHRTAMVSSLATAAVLALVGVPLLLQRSEVPHGYGAERMRVVRTYEGSKVAPVVLESEDGNTIIWVVDQEPQGGEEEAPREAQDEAAPEEELKPAAPGHKQPGGDTRSPGGEL
jgi:anti-sigma factor RsiW